MKLTTFVTAALLLAAPAMHAAASTFSSPVETLTVNVGTNALAFSNDFTSKTAGDTFADRFYFTLAGVSDIDFTATSTAARKNTGLDLTGFGIYDASTNTLVKGATLTYLNRLNVLDKYSLLADDLAAGSYYFRVDGKMLSGSASFSGNGVITVSPVPEPAMPVMLLGGLGLLAFVARRKAQ
jgi:hypothetical protein